MSQETEEVLRGEVAATTSSEGVMRSAKGKFLPGTKKTGGRVKGAPTRMTWYARDVFEQKGVNPILVALEIVTNGLLPIASGEDPKTRKPVSSELRVKVLLELLNYTFPRLSAQQITGANGGPIAMATCDISKLMEDPELASMAQELAIALATGDGQPDNPALLDGPGAGVGPRRPTNGGR